MGAEPLSMGVSILQRVRSVNARNKGETCRFCIVGGSKSLIGRAESATYEAARVRLTGAAAPPVGARHQVSIGNRLNLLRRVE